MDDNSRLEFTISASDTSAPVVNKTKANFKSLEQQATESAQNVSSKMERAAADAARSMGTWKDYLSQNLTAAIKQSGSFGAAMQQLSADWKSLRATAAAESIELTRAVETATTGALRRVETLSRQAALAGKTGIERLRAQMDSELTKLGTQGLDEANLQKVRRLYESRIGALQQRKIASLTGSPVGNLSEGERLTRQMESQLKQLAELGAAEELIAKRRAEFQAAIHKSESEGEGSNRYAIRRGLLGVKDFFEGRTQGTIIEATDVLIGGTGGGGILKGSLGTLSEITGLAPAAVIGISSIAAAVAGLGIAGLAAEKALAKTSEEIKNASLRTGIAPTNIQEFQFAARRSGVDPSILEKLNRGLAQLADDNSSAGAKARQEVARLGVSLTDNLGNLRPTEQIITDLAVAIGKLQPGLQQSAASMEIFKRVGIEAVPFLKELPEALKRSDELGPTLSKEDLELGEDLKKRFTDLGEEWSRLKQQIEIPLVVTLETVFKIGHEIEKNAAVAAPKLLYYAAKSSFEGAVAPDQFPPPEKPQAPGTQYADRLVTDARIQARGAAGGIDDQLEEARKALREVPVPQLGRASAADEDAYEAALAKVKRLESAQKAQSAGLQDVIAAAKERQQLLSESAQIAEESRLKELSATQSATKELASPEDRIALLDLAKQRAIAEENKIINEHRTRVDEKSGQIVDLSNTAGFRSFLDAENANLPQRIENEQAKVLAELADRDAKYFQLRTDADGKAWAEAIHRREQQEQQLWQDVQRLEEAGTQRYFQMQESQNNRERDLALGQLGLVDAQTLKEKEALEEKKFQIEAFYAQRSTQLQIEKLNHDETYALGELRKKYPDVSEDNPEYVSARQATIQEFEDKKAELAQATNDKISLDAQQTINQRAKYEIEENKRVFDSLKHDSEGIFDALLTKSKSFSDALKDLFKNAVLTPIKDILSSQTAALFTELLTGKKVTFEPVGNGQGPLGKVGDVLGRLGLGAPKFGSSQHEASKLNLPNHLGDVTLVNSDGSGSVANAVPVVITNTDQMAQSHAKTQIQSQSSDIPMARAADALGSLAYGQLFDGIMQDLVSQERPGYRYIPGPRAVLPSPVNNIAPSGITATVKNYNVGGTPVAGSESFGYGAPALGGSGPSAYSLAFGGGGAGSDLIGGLPDLLGQSLGGDAGAAQLGNLLGSDSGSVGGFSNIYGDLPGAPAFLGGSGSSSGGGLGDLSAFGNGGTGIFHSLDGLLGGPGGTSGFAGPVGGANGSGGGFFSGILGNLFGIGQGGGGHVFGDGAWNDGSGIWSLTGGGQSGGGGILGNILGGGGGSGSGGGFLGKLLGGGSGGGGLLSSIYNPTDIPLGAGEATTAAGISQSLGGGLLGSIGGGLAGFANSAGGTTLGLGLGLNGIQRGGVAGTLEAAGGGALVGFRFGGPIGAAIGAAVGAGAALIRTFIGDDVSHTKDLVKQIYGVKIDDNMAKQIIQIAKQSFGGEISVAVRSPQVRQLIGLYSQATGQKNPTIADTPHAASLVESGGKLFQQAQYINGQAYSYASPLSVYGGVQTSPLPTSNPSSVVVSSLQLHIGDSSASSFLNGQIADTVTPGYVQNQYAQAQASSNGRVGNAAMLQQPGLVTS